MGGLIARRTLTRWATFYDCMFGLSCMSIPYVACRYGVELCVENFGHLRYERGTDDVAAGRALLQRHEASRQDLDNFAGKGVLVGAGGSRYVSIGLIALIGLIRRIGLCRLTWALGRRFSCCRSEDFGFTRKACSHGATINKNLSVVWSKLLLVLAVYSSCGRKLVELVKFTPFFAGRAASQPFWHVPTSSRAASRVCHIEPAQACLIT